MRGSRLARITLSEEHSTCHIPLGSQRLFFETLFSQYPKLVSSLNAYHRKFDSRLSHTFVMPRSDEWLYRCELRHDLANLSESDLTREQATLAEGGEAVLCKWVGDKIGLRG